MIKVKRYCYTCDRFRIAQDKGLSHLENNCLTSEGYLRSSCHDWESIKASNEPDGEVDPVDEVIIGLLEGKDLE